MKLKIAFASTVFALLAASPAAATEVIGNFDTGLSYGTLSGGGFVDYTHYTNGEAICLGLGECYNGAEKYAIIAQSGTAGELLIHPGPGEGGNSAIEFSATTAGTYSLNALLTSHDTGTKDVGFFTIIGGTLTTVTTGTIFGGTPYGIGGLSAAANDFNVKLGVGDSLGVFVNNDGDYTGDTTHVSGTVSAVPESATWAMMLVGFGMIGFGLRRRQSKVTTNVQFA